ncbi:helix-turn-helix domain-containing protein [Botrimarina mediterranea]|uniref:Helix-turn-helix domain protein n=1 Tax=Botrimarina mediterranea TaxID=2528022 RepID=A0A518K9T2_9BACT|nr:helix-turn-helix domain-containing protein [Botrimarina mediterranea]QDV74557.1 Helix-turn-helix domain protein [Botrimarina mediterranea]QDV79197.1 Helix-turn-helix domain protein [Planctomycetes bacterium K2D]
MNTVRATAEKLGVSEKTVRGLIQAGRIEHHRVGLGRGVIRITDQAISDYLQSTRVGLSESSASDRQPRQRLKHLKL